MEYLKSVQKMITMGLVSGLIELLVMVVVLIIKPHLFFDLTIELLLVCSIAWNSAFGIMSYFMRKGTSQLATTAKK